MAHASMTARTADHLWQLELEIAEVVRADLGLHEARAAALASRLVLALRQSYGGMRLGRRGLYIPAPDKSGRDESIAREFDGRNAGELMRRHGISRSRLYQIVRQTRKSAVSSREIAQPAG